MDDGERIKAVAKVAQSLFKEDGVALVPLVPEPKGDKPSLLEQTVTPVGKSTVEKTVKRMLWNHRQIPAASTGGGAVLVYREGESVMVGLCDLEVSSG